MWNIALTRQRSVTFVYAGSLCVAPGTTGVWVHVVPWKDDSESS